MDVTIENLEIASTELTPDVYADSQKGELIISGKIVLYDAMVFFKPITEWYKQYIQGGGDTLNVILDIAYLSTTAYHCVYELLTIARNRKDMKPEVHFYWYYPNDDDDILEMGEDFQSIAKVPFYLKERK